MNDTINTGINNFNLGLQNLAVTPPDFLTPGSDKIQDTVSTSKSDENLFTFTTPESPKLPPPPADANSGGMEILNNILKNFTGDFAALAETAPSIDMEFMDEVGSNIDDISSEDIDEMNLGIPSAQVIKKIRYTIFNPKANEPEQIKALANEIRNKAIAKTGKEPSTFFADLTEKAAEAGYFAILKTEFKNMGYCEIDQQQLLAANDMPEFVSKLPADMQKKLATAQQKALLGVQDDLGLPKTWPIPRNPEAYETNVSNAFEQKIGDKLYAMFSKGKISNAAYNDLRTLLYLPGSTPPNGDKLKADLEVIVNEAKADVQEKWGFPNDYEPSINPHDYQAILTGTYYAAAKNAIDTHKPPLSDKDKALLSKALISPSHQEALSTELKSILSFIQHTALGKVSKQYSLPSHWKPNAEMLAATEKLDTPKLRLARNALDTGKEFMSRLQDLITIYSKDKSTDISHITPPPQSQTNSGPSMHDKLLNYLKACSAAMSGSREVLFASSVTQANLAKMASRIEQDTTVGQLATQKKELENIRKKQAKMASLGPLKIIAMIILAVLTVCTYGALGFLFFSLLAANSIIQHGNDISSMDLFGDFANLVQKVVKKIVKAVSTEAKAENFDEKVGKLIRGISIFVMIAVCPMFLIGDLMFGEGSTIKILIEGFGIPENIAGYISMAIQILFMIVTVILSFFFAPPAAFAKIGHMVSAITSKIATMIPKAIVTACNFVIQSLQAASKGNSVISQIAKYILEFALKLKKAILKAATNVGKFSKEIKKTETALLKAAEEVTKHEKRVEALRQSLTATAKEISKAENLLNEAKVLQENTLRSLKLLQAQQPEIEAAAKAVKEALEEVEKAFLKLQDLKAAGTKGPALEAARAALEKAAINLNKVETMALDTYANFTAKALEMTAQACDKAQEALDQARKNTELLAKQLKTAQNEHALAVQSGRHVETAASHLEQVTKQLNLAQSAEEAAKASYNGAMQAASQQLSRALAPIQNLSGATDMVKGMIQGGVHLNNQILQTQIALIRGALEAYITETQTLIKIWQSLSKKLLDGLRELGQTLSRLGSERQRYWEALSVVATDMARAMR